MTASPMVWLAAHKAVAMGGAGAVGLGLYMRKKNAAAVGGAGSTPVSTATPVGAATSSTYDSTAQDVYSSIEPQLGSLQAQLANLSAGTAAPSASPYDTAGWAAYGRQFWAYDTAQAKLSGTDTSRLQAPSDFGTYGAARYSQNAFALANRSTPAAKLPGADFTVQQQLAENANYAAGKLGPPALGATV